MIYKHKAVFLPINKRVINNYKGYILNGDFLELPEDQIMNVEIVYDSFSNHDKELLLERIARLLFVIVTSPILILIFAVAHIMGKSEEISQKFESVIKAFFAKLFRRKARTWEKRTLKKEYGDAIKEDVPAFLFHCNNCGVNVYLYTYSVLTDNERTKVSKLIKDGYIKNYYKITRLTDLGSVVTSENISLHNSSLVITQTAEKGEAELLGFNTLNGECRNVELLMDRNMDGAGELEWNSSPTFIGLKHRISPYLKAKNSAFFNEETVLFIDDTNDLLLNGYLTSNLERITTRFQNAGKNFIYFPSYRFSGSINDSQILDFIRYRSPVLYAFSNDELTQLIEIALRRVTPAEFYEMVFEVLQLPFFKRPSLLRKVPGQITTSNLFISTPIKSQTQAELDKFFDAYIHRISNEKNDGPFFSLVPPPEEYDADSYFSWESNEFTEELKSKIDTLRKENKHEALVDTIMYMLSTIKEDRPDIIEKVKPLLERRKLLEPKVVLSSLVVDKHCNIFLPDFGNKELKLHALPKTVYLLFLRHPNGIRFKELYQYKAELLEIYNKVTNRYEKQEIERAINDLVDMTNPSINQKCARIKEAFCNIMGDHIARYYYITGERGEPRSISLPQELIEFRDK